MSKIEILHKIKWETRFQELVEYKRVHGNCNVPRANNANQHLGRWVMTQRTTKETMSEERRKRLNSIGFTWKVQEAQFAFHWEVRFQQLVEYQRIHGHCIVPQHYKANKQLGLWVNTQRTQKETMREERRNMLDSVGFVWKLREAHISVDWEVRFQELVDYKRVYGNCNVPQRYKANTQLGRWIYTQRRTKETMSENKRNQLNSVGFVWSLKAARPKEQPRVRPSTEEDQKKKKARLDEEAAQEGTGFQQKSWDSNFEQLCDFVRTYKHCNVSAQHPELGRWAEEQRQLYERKQIGKETRSDLLTDEREAKLMAVGFGFETTSSDDEDKDWTTAVSKPSCIPYKIYS